MNLNFIAFLIGFILGLSTIDFIESIYEKIFYKKEKNKVKHININGTNYFFSLYEPEEIKKYDVWFECDPDEIDLNTIYNKTKGE